jgi:PHP family Zn ribbon phosphoesterase
MITLKNVTDVDNGAKFLNADLHVHSYAASVDVNDRTMTPEAIIEAAVKQGISVLAITDHNTDKNVAPAQEYALKYAGTLLVLPGVEITTAHGHLLAYFSPAQAEHVGKLMAKIDLRGEMGAQDSHTSMSMADVIREVERPGGLSVAAHIDRTKTGFDKLHDGFPNWKRDIITSSGLYGLEVDSASNLNLYSPDDDHTPQGIERRRIGESRSKL